MKLINRLFNKSRPGKEKIPLNPLTLSFSSNELNRGFTEVNSQRSVRIVRLSLIVAVLIYISFGLIDQYIIARPEKLVGFRIIGIAEFLLVIVLTYTKMFRRYNQAVLSLLILIGGINVVVIALQDTGSLYTGLILTSIYAHSLLRIRFIYASSSTWALILIYFYHLFSSEAGENTILNNIFFLVNANLLGMFSSYSIEYFMRREYWQSYLLKEKSIELTREHRRVINELESAREVQLSLIPRELPDVPGLNVSAHIESASEIGGDFYDFKVLPENELILAIGDATGHGAKAGAMVTAIKILFSEYADSFPIEELMAKINSSLRNIKLPSLYMSFAVAKIKNRKLEITGTGMPPMFILRKDNSVQKIELKGIPLGVIGNATYKKYTLDLKEGDRIVLMTDGLPESFNNKFEMLGYERVSGFLKNCKAGSSEEIITSLLELKNSWSSADHFTDDLTLIVIGVEDNFQSYEYSHHMPENRNSELISRGKNVSQNIKTSSIISDI